MQFGGAKKLEFWNDSFFMDIPYGFSGNRHSSTKQNVVKKHKNDDREVLLVRLFCEELQESRF